MIIYIVQPGDTLSIIAQRFNVTVREIIETNPIRSDLNIFPGQILFIGRGREEHKRDIDCWPKNPCPGDPWPMDPPSKPCPGDPWPMDPPSNPCPGDPWPMDPWPMDPWPWPGHMDPCPGDRRHAYYVVQRGDTLSIIANRFETSVQAIVRANNLEGPNSTIYPGQILRIPVSMGSLATEEEE